MQKKEFLNYIHYFRGLAILFIVALHACVNLMWEDRVLQRKALVVLFNNGTVLFVFIAGFLFYHLNKDRFDYFNYLKKKFTYVVLPYLFVSIPAILDKFLFDKAGEHWWLNQTFEDLPAAGKVIYLLLTGRHMGVFWFIPMITIIYFLAPLILRFARTQAFMYIVPALTIAGFFTFRFGYFANIWLSLQYFLPVYLFGIWVYRIKDFLFAHARTFLLITGLLFFGLTLLEMLEWVPFSETISLREVQYTVYRFHWNKMKVHILAIAALLFFYYWPERRYPILKLMGNYSFGIYFVHLYVVQIFRLLDLKGYFPISPPNLITFIIYFCAVLSITIGLVKLVRITFKQRSRYFIGS